MSNTTTGTTAPTQTEWEKQIADQIAQMEAMVASHGLPENYDGWVIAYTDTSPGMRSGYMGKVDISTAKVGQMLYLTEAFEYIAVERVDANGVHRNSHGSPIEFSRDLTTIHVDPCVIVSLDGLRGMDLALHQRAHIEAKAMREQLKNGPKKMEQQPAMVAVKTPGLVGPDGRPIA